MPKESKIKNNKVKDNKVIDTLAQQEAEPQKDTKQEKLFEFEYKPVVDLEREAQEPEKADIKIRKRRKTKKEKQGLKASTDFVVNLTDLLFKKLGEPLNDDEKEMLSVNTSEALTYNFPNINEKVSPNITLLLGFGALILPRLPTFVRKYKETKKQKEVSKAIKETQEKQEPKPKTKEPEADATYTYLKDLQQAEREKQRTYKEIKKLEGGN